MEALRAIDYSEKLKPFLSKEVQEAMSTKVMEVFFPGKYEVKYIGITFNKITEEETALKEIARKLQMVFDIYGIIGSLVLCNSIDLVGPEGIASPSDPNWDYEKDPIGPGTLGWGLTKEEQDKLLNRRILISYPALDWEIAQKIEGKAIFIEEGSIPQDWESYDAFIMVDKRNEKMQEMRINYYC